MRILYISPWIPAAEPCGAQMRSAQLIAALQDLGQVDCVVVNFADQIERAAVEPDSGPRIRRLVPLQPIGARSVWARLRCGLDPRFLKYHGHGVRGSDQEAVLGGLPTYDLVWLHHLRTADVFDQWLWPRSVMDLDDVPSTLLCSDRCDGEGRVGRAGAAVKRLVARRRERLLAERFTVLSVCSEADRRYLDSRADVHVIPNGFAKPVQDPARQPSQPPRVGFIGAFGYAPNAEGARWFAKECWPLLKREVPDARLRLAGKESDGPLKPAGPDIDGLGWVADAAQEMATWSVMVVPVRAGGGTRVKLAEGFSRKCPIVSTSLGAYGYEVTDGRELFVADSARGFADACARAIRQPAEAAQMAERAWQRFLRQWTWDAIRPRIRAAAEDCLRPSGRGLAQGMGASLGR